MPGNSMKRGNFFPEALQYYPDFGEAQLGLAAVLMSLQKPELALPHLQRRWR